jgi:hypothetical protein
MGTDHIDETADYILTVLRSGGPVMWSWGAKNFRAAVYEGMAALRFSVSGFVHVGDVAVALNKGADVFEVYCLDCNDTVVSSRDGVYLDELVGTVDGLVEKEGSDAEYDKKRRQWLAENPL